MSTKLHFVLAAAILLSGMVTISAGLNVNKAYAKKEIILYYKDDGSIGIGYHDDDCMCSHTLVSPDFDKDSFKNITSGTNITESLLTFPKEYVPNLPPGTNITIAANDIPTLFGEYIHLLGDHPSDDIKNKIQSLLTLNGSISDTGKRNTSTVTTLKP